MRITFCHKTANRSGGNRVVAQYADRLVRRGHEVSVVTGPEATPGLRRRARLTVRSVLAGNGLPRFVKYPASMLDEMPYIRHHRVAEARPFVDADFPDADVVVATWWETAEWIARLSPAKGKKVYFIQGHESTIDGMPAARVEATLDLPLYPITIAEFLVAHLKERHGRTDVALVPNSVDLSRFDAPARGKSARPTVVCLYTGEARIKGFDVTMAALFEVKLRVPDLRVVCFGTQAPPPGFFPSFVEYHRDPAQDDIPRLYASADVYAHGSRVEGFGLPILEAMACRTPVVATPAGAAPELLREGRGRMITTLDPSEMARALVEVLAMPEPAWRALSLRAYAHAHGYTLEDATARFEAALEHARASS